MPGQFTSIPKDDIAKVIQSGAFTSLCRLTILPFLSGGMQPRNMLTKANLFKSVGKVGSVNLPQRLIWKRSEHM